jgi:hypothetical protein
MRHARADCIDALRRPDNPLLIIDRKTENLSMQPSPSLPVTGFRVDATLSPSTINRILKYQLCNIVHNRSDGAHLTTNISHFQFPRKIPVIPSRSLFLS